MKPIYPAIRFDTALDSVFAVLPDGISGDTHQAKHYQRHVYNTVYAKLYGIVSIERALSTANNPMPFKAVVIAPTRDAITGFLLPSSPSLSPPDTSSFARLYRWYQANRNKAAFVPYKTLYADATPGAPKRDPPENPSIHPLSDDNDLSTVQEVNIMMQTCMRGLASFIPLGPPGRVIEIEKRLANLRGTSSKKTFLPGRPTAVSPKELRAWIGQDTIDLADTKNLVPVWPMIERIWTGMDLMEKAPGGSGVPFELNPMSDIFEVDGKSPLIHRHDCYLPTATFLYHVSTL
ncbi:hypothetical protein KVT40_006808 [Elsinoe batatas]|uniref:Uncharacterized protein n=1 Tax=Elsinoe batatas TaxID=2601811 RepID=A0A8K0KXA7_9PEZI|nr:hypothetical protein KVT40_006808 [Elsinoe batatas]